MKNIQTYEQNLLNLLVKAESIGLNSDNVLDHPLCNDLAIAAVDFFSMVYRSQRSVRLLSAMKMDPLSVVDMSSMKLLTNLSQVLSVPVDCRIPFLVTLANNVLLDEFRSFSRYSGRNMTMDDVSWGFIADGSLSGGETMEDHFSDQDADKQMLMELFQFASGNLTTLQAVGFLSTRVCDIKPSVVARVLLDGVSMERVLKDLLQMAHEEFRFSVDATFEKALKKAVSDPERFLANRMADPALSKEEQIKAISTKLSKEGNKAVTKLKNLRSERQKLAA